MQIKGKLRDVFKTGVDTGTSGASERILLQVMVRVKDIDRNCSSERNGEGIAGSVFPMQQSRAVHQRRAGCTPDFMRLMVERGFMSDTIIELEVVKGKFSSAGVYGVA